MTTTMAVTTMIMLSSRYSFDKMLRLYLPVFRFSRLHRIGDFVPYVIERLTVLSVSRNYRKMVPED